MAEPDVTRDTLLGGRVPFVQPRKGYRAAIDPVLLAAAVDAKPGQSVLDMGCGTGAVFLCLSARVPTLDITGIDKAADAIRLAQENARLNDLMPVLVAGDVFDPASSLPDSFDHVVTNPPFWSTAQSRQSPDPGKRQAHSLPPDALGEWIEVCAARLRHRGVLSLILPASLAADAIAAASRTLGSVSILPLWPKQGTEARRVVLQAVRGGRGPSVIHTGLVLHEADGSYTAGATRILSGGESLWDVMSSVD